GVGDRRAGAQRGAVGGDPAVGALGGGAEVLVALCAVVRTVPVRGGRAAAAVGLDLADGAHAAPFDGGDPGGGGVFRVGSGGCGARGVRGGRSGGRQGARAADRRQGARDGTEPGGGTRCHGRPRLCR